MNNKTDLIFCRYCNKSWLQQNDLSIEERRSLRRKNCECDKTKDKNILGKRFSLTDIFIGLKNG